MIEQFEWPDNRTWEEIESEVSWAFLHGNNEYIRDQLKGLFRQRETLKAMLMAQMVPATGEHK